MCLGDLVGCEQATRSYAGPLGSSSPDVVDVFDGTWLLDGSDSDSDCSTDGEQWELESTHDPISLSEM